MIMKVSLKYNHFSVLYHQLVLDNDNERPAHSVPEALQTPLDQLRNFDKEHTRHSHLTSKVRILDVLQSIGTASNNNC